MSKNIIKVILSLLSTFLFINIAIASDYFFKHISIEQGLSQPGVNSILRDYNGALWIGTRQGLNRVNRNDLKIYFHDNKNNGSIAGNHIYNLNEDEQHNLWVISDGGLSLYNRDEDSFETKINGRIQAMANIKGGVLFGSFSAIYFYDYKTKKIVRLPLVNKDINRDIPNKDYFISHLIPITDSLILAGTEGDGVFIYNMTTHDFTPFIIKDMHPLQSVLYDRESNEIFISVFQKGLFRYDMKGTLKKHYTAQNSGLANNIILDIKKHKNKIWLATDGSGIDMLDTQTDKFENIEHIAGDINSLPVNSITVLYTDSNDNLWAGSVRDGVFLFKETYIRTYKDITLGSNKGLSEKVVISLFEDKSTNLWIGTDGGGLNMFNPETETFTHHLNTYGDKVVSITDLSDNELLLSLYGKGVFTYNINSRSYKPFVIINQDINKEECFSGFVPICHRITADKILILAKNAYVYNTQSQRFDILKYANGLKNLHSLQLLYSDNDRCFMAKGNTVYMLDNKENLIKQFLVLEENEYISSICYDKSKNRLWIASTGGLKYFDINSEKLEKIKTNMFNQISYMYFDMENHLWINASNMLFSYDIRNNTFMIWDDSDGFLLNEILTFYVKPSRSNFIYMGGSNGLVKIDKNISYDEDIPISFNLQDIELNGKTFQGNIFSHSDHLEVPQNYSSLKIRVNLKEKDMFRHILFRYRINNQNHNSIIESYSNILDLASLAPGKYDIYVSCMTKSGSWTSETSLITFDVMPPWYKRTWFNMLISVLAIGIVSLSLFMLTKRNKRKMRWEMAMHRQELNEDKIQFLTNVSHELRTPLTLIYAPLKRILENKEGNIENPALREQIENIFHQANHMKGVINWILEYDKYTTLSDDMNISFISINDLIGDIATDFQHEFEERNIDLKLELDNELMPIEMDETKIRVVISNLLMNALKFSNENTSVTIRSALEGNMVCVQIKDEGIGLEGVDSDKLFTRFYQGEHNRKGSGIGLAYCKELIEKHGGTIHATDNEGDGASLYFYLPYKTTPDNVILSKLDNSELYHSLFKDEDTTVYVDTSIYTVLIVDDNKEFQRYLDSELKPLFKKVLKAGNGAEALEISKQSQPDILVSDVMMPVMNGYELCKAVKDDIEISHIPIILLTAKSDSESQKIGYKLGADFYLSKPFDIDLLLSVINNQLTIKKSIKQKYQKEIMPITPEQSTISNADEQFMIRLNQLIKENYADSTFDVSAIVDSLAMSRASLYSKMKNIAGLGINDYINKYRIGAACSLLSETDKSIADIAFETGFTSQRYFSTVFKQATGKTPSNYRIDSRKVDNN